MVWDLPTFRQCRFFFYFSECEFIMVIYCNDKIYTMSENRETVTAFAASDDGIIRATGEREELKGIYPDARVEELEGECVIPGIIDTHAHLFMVADSEADREMLIPLNLEDLFSDIRRRVKSEPEGTWIAYPNTYPLRLDELRYPTLAELDEIAPKHPVSIDGFYSAQVNSAALNALDLSKLPPGGKVILSDSGAMTGTLLNCNAILSPHYIKRTKTALTQAIKNALAGYSAMGITTTVEAISNTDGMAAVAELAKKGEQNVRVRYTQMLPRGTDYVELIKKARSIDCVDENLARLIMCKKTVDGGILTGTSYMEDEYNEIEGIFGLVNIGDDWRGNLVTDVDELEEGIYAAQRAGLSFGAHCVGSGASEKLLRAFERVNEREPIAKYRHALMHADFMNKSQLKRAADIGVCIHFQPAWHYMDAPFVERIAGKSEMDRFMPYADIAQSGVKAGAGSDHMAKYHPDLSCNPYNPYTGLYNMVTCKARDGKAYGEHQRISRDKALAYYTCDAAWVISDEKLTGSLEVGKRADFAVLNNDYFTCAQD